MSPMKRIACISQSHWAIYALGEFNDKVTLA